MKYLIISTTALFSHWANSQIMNQCMNSQKAGGLYSNNLTASTTHTEIVGKAIFNAKPSGYHMIFTTSSIGYNVEDVEKTMNKKVDSLISDIQALNLINQKALVDVIEFEPIFDFSSRETSSSSPSGYKMTENILFDVLDLTQARKLIKKCLEYGIYDLIEIKPYVLHTSPIHDSLNKVLTKIIQQKKKLSQELGIQFAKGETQVDEYDYVFYPNERYLKSTLHNTNLYSHHMSQNTLIHNQRSIDIQKFDPIDLSKVDYVFNSELNEPTIQFYKEIVYQFFPKIEEEKKESKDEKVERIFYVIDKNGELKKVDF